MNLKSKIVTIATASILALSVASGATAQQSAQVTQKITGGQFTYSLTNGTMQEIKFDYANDQVRKTTGEMTLSVDDARGTKQGWTVSLASTAFDYDGVAPNPDSYNIPAGNLTVRPADPTTQAGEAGNVNKMGGGPMNGEVQVIQAQPGYGSGKYVQKLPVELSVPPKSPVGTYTATITVSTTAAPGAQG